MSIIERERVCATVVVGSTLNDAIAITFGGYSGAIIHVPTGESPVSLTYYVATDESSSPTYNALKDYEGTAASTPCEGDDAVEVHPAVFAAPSFKVVAEAVTGDALAYPITFKS